MRSPGPPRRRPSTARLLVVAVVSWIVFLTVVILLDPHSAGSVP